MNTIDPESISNIIRELDKKLDGINRQITINNIINDTDHPLKTLSQIYPLNSYDGGTSLVNYEFNI